jgi:hypothetical protein
MNHGFNIRRKAAFDLISHGMLLTTFPGGTMMATVEQVRAFAKGGSARVQQ